MLPKKLWARIDKKELSEPIDRDRVGRRVQENLLKMSWAVRSEPSPSMKAM